MKILITGAKGMLGRTLMRRLSNHDCLGIDIEDCNITNICDVEQTVADFGPNVVIHCAAMTAVDDCESQVDAAYRVNAIGSKNVAIVCHRHSARLIAISTDYVFAGDKDCPYDEFDSPAPKTAYGASKLAGEQAIRENCPDHLILRVAWLYGPGGPSFVHAMLKLGGQGGDALKIVDDQIGSPTSTDAVAGHIELLLTHPISGTVNLTCEGETSWYGLTKEIFALAALDRGIGPCTTAEFPRPAPRPTNSVLDNRVLRLQGIAPMPHWREALQTFLKDNPNG